MLAELLRHGGASDARCVGCGAAAVGPCARCHDPVCGDCCVLTTGGHSVFAICLHCDRRGGRSLRSGWAQVLVWILAPIAGLIALLALLYTVFGDLAGR